MYFNQIERQDCVRSGQIMLSKPKDTDNLKDNQDSQRMSHGIIRIMKPHFISEGQRDHDRLDGWNRVIY